MFPATECHLSIVTSLPYPQKFLNSFWLQWMHLLSPQHAVLLRHDGPQNSSQATLRKTRPLWRTMHNDMCSQPQKAIGVLPHLCSTPERSPTAVGYNGGTCFHLNMTFFCSRTRLRTGNTQKHPLMTRPLWRTMACVPSCKRPLECCHIPHLPLKGLLLPWVAMEALAYTSTCHSAAAAGWASEQVKLRNIHQ